MQQLLRVCVRERPLARTAASALFLIFALCEIVLGFQDNCNCLVLSGFLHVCFVLDRATQWLPPHYQSLRGTPDGFNRLHLLLRLANLYLMVFLCLDCVVEAIVDFRKVTVMNPTTVPVILLASFVLQMITNAADRSKDARGGAAALSGTPGDALFGPGSSAAAAESGGGGRGVSGGVSGDDGRSGGGEEGSSSVPARVGSVGFLVFAVIQYVLPHDEPVRWADSAVTLVAAVAVLARAGPSLRGHTLFFMQATPSHKRAAAQACLQQVEAISGVIECVISRRRMHARTHARHPHREIGRVLQYSYIAKNEYNIAIRVHRVHVYVLE